MHKISEIASHIVISVIDIPFSLNLQRQMDSCDYREIQLYSNLR